MAHYMATDLPVLDLDTVGYHILPRPLSLKPFCYSTPDMIIDITQFFTGNGQLSGVVCDKNGNTITGVQCDVAVFNKATYKLIGRTKSNSSDGTWSLNYIAPKDTKVIAVFSYEGTYLGDTDIAGAEFLTYI